MIVNSGVLSLNFGITLRKMITKISAKRYL